MEMGTEWILLNEMKIHRMELDWKYVLALPEWETHDENNFLQDQNENYHNGNGNTQH